ncbi:N-fatty-acyl-amino acid synthase/hydrolase PM20D1.2-like [Sycon ciliatum]|uniref:N-fatty-acyl-amino acid synthase/hydrolase PM20D1.2-like n=1 Tax=Sycon ciliatum TaxID=27933 RepID=UPI0020AA8F59
MSGRAVLYVLLCSVLALLVGRTIWFGSRIVDPEPCGTNEEPIPVGDTQYTRLAKAIQIKTISYTRSQSNQTKLALIELSNFLRREYQHVFSSPYIDVEVVANYSLLMRVAGQDASLQPYLLMSHLDVVPAVSPEWQVDPFAGVVDEEFIWGRGAIDVKNTLLAIMEVVNSLAKANQRPKRSFYIAFGHDEEVGGRQGAVRIAALLKERGVRFKFILDEGLPVMEDIFMPGRLATVGVAEKGILTLRLSVNMTGGHSSLPMAESAISVLSRAVARLSHTAHPHHFGSGIEVAMLEHLAPVVPLAKCFAISNLWLFGPIVAWTLAQKGETAATIRTTTAVTIMRAGFKANVIPGYAEAIVNHRVHPKDTFEDVIRRNHEIINDARVVISVDEEELLNTPPTPVSSWSSFGFSVISKSVRQVFNSIPVAPGMF